MKNYIESFVNKFQSELPSRQKDSVANERIDNTIDINNLSNKINFIEGSFEDKTETRDFIRALARLVIELEDQVPHYDTVLSDDASGRLVAIFLSQVINKKKLELNEQSVQTYFLQGGGHQKEGIYEAVDDFISQKKSSIGKALLVTEHIASGNSINSMVKKLEGQDIDFDVASLSVSEEFLSEKDKEKFKKLTKRVRYGGENAEGLDLYNQPFTGVRKNHKSGAHPMRIKDPSLQKSVGEARKDIRLMAKEISKLI